MPRVCVFCGSSSGDNPKFAAVARDVGYLLAEHAWELVYGGGHVGLMGVLADAVLSRQGRVTGVIPQKLRASELAHGRVQDMRVVNSMLQRKETMIDLSDAFVALPGGLGTLDELFEVVTWRQLGFVDKPCAVLNVEGLYDPLFSFLDQLVARGFVAPAHRALLTNLRGVEELTPWLSRVLERQP